MSYGDRERLKLIRLYQDETGILEYKMIDVAVWIEQRRGYKMPTPPTAAELLAKQLAKTASGERRGESGYRGNLVRTRVVNGQVEFYWFDSDGPAATEENVQGSLDQRRDQMLNVGVQSRIDAEHWLETHPGGQLRLNFDLDDEVTWRVNAPKPDKKRRAG